MIKPLRGVKPKIGSEVFIAPSADIIGDVEIDVRSSVWYRVVIRGDVMPIKVGRETNIQDGCVLHGTQNKCGVNIGNRVTVGHSVVLHGCDIGDECLIGMGSVVMDLAKIGNHSVVGAGSLVTEGSEFPDGSLILGRPAKVKRALTDQEIQFLSQSADNYLKYMSWYEEDGEEDQNG